MAKVGCDKWPKWGCAEWEEMGEGEKKRDLPWNSQDRPNVISVINIPTSPADTLDEARAFGRVHRIDKRGRCSEWLLTPTLPPRRHGKHVLLIESAAHALTFADAARLRTLYTRAGAVESGHGIVVEEPGHREELATPEDLTHLSTRSQFER